MLACCYAPRPVSLINYYLETETMFKPFRANPTNVGKSVLLTAVILVLGVNASVANAVANIDNNPFIDPQNQVPPQNQAAYVDFKEEAIVIPCLLIKGFDLIGENTFYRVKMKQQHFQKGSAMDWKVVEAIPAPACTKPSDPLLDEANNQIDDQEGQAPEDKLPVQNQQKPHRPKPNGGQPGTNPPTPEVQPDTAPPATL
jgi:hypothetical protein